MSTFRHRDERIVCGKCNREFIKRITVYPCKMEDKRNRESSYFCPYCKEGYSEYLSADEDVEGIK